MNRSISPSTGRGGGDCAAGIQVPAANTRNSQGGPKRREGAAVPADWDEAGYLQVHPDVAIEIARGTFVSGYHHYLAAGRGEGRLGGFQPVELE